ncbi:MAG TPA: YdeI/OmpD-associated family protein [Gemmatimonadaceae bacterium]|nr:YdeI/OmpD-associated family protein [Gemmatimonadaceae bacterium]
MGTRDPRVDAYIARSAEFAHPILTHLRGVVHDACPTVEETIKWGMPFFMHHGILCMMAAFKAHCTFGFWKGALIVGNAGQTADAAMGQFGRITAVSDLPSRAQLARYVRQAMKLNEEGAPVVRKPPSVRKKTPAVPAELAAVLRKNGKARAGFDALSPSHRREYIEWITEAKREETRARRVAQAVEWMADGKSRNWKYERK